MWSLQRQNHDAQYLTPRVAENFVLRQVSINFVLKELSKLKVTKISGPYDITARLLNDPASSSYS